MSGYIPEFLCAAAMVTHSGLTGRAPEITGLLVSFTQVLNIIATNIWWFAVGKQHSEKLKWGIKLKGYFILKK